jgi:hypothetical protein
MSDNELRIVFISRRQLLRRALATSAGIVGAGVLAAACKHAPAALRCDDTTGLAPVDTATRKALEYVDASPDPQKTCVSCAQFTAPSVDGTCGGCKMFKGTVNPKGFCKSWAAKVAT